MNTAAAQLRLVDSPFVESTTPEGKKQILILHGDFTVEIFPETTVGFLFHEMRQEIADILDLYIHDMKKTVGVLERGMIYLNASPKIEYSTTVGDNLTFRMRRVGSTKEVKYFGWIAEKKPKGKSKKPEG